MPERNFANRTLYHGDNLDFLRGMNSGTVDLIRSQCKRGSPPCR